MVKRAYEFRRCEVCNIVRIRSTVAKPKQRRSGVFLAAAGALNTDQTRNEAPVAFKE
jgi:hypothetical protein